MLHCIACHEKTIKTLGNKFWQVGNEAPVREHILSVSAQFGKCTLLVETIKQCDKMKEQFNFRMLFLTFEKIFITQKVPRV